MRGCTGAPADDPDAAREALAIRGRVSEEVAAKLISWIRVVSPAMMRLIKLEKDPRRSLAILPGKLITRQIEFLRSTNLVFLPEPIWRMTTEPSLKFLSII
jgi:hypothetical protein